MSYFLYTVIIYPLYQIIEFIYQVFFKICENEGISIIGVSAGVTLLCLPLYAVAEHWQQVERNTQKELKPGIDRIKSTFKGDEQYMVLSTFYKQHHYHPMMALRSSFGLLIQIPFFIAAYIYLSNNQELANKSFLFIRNMSKPDAIFSIGSFPVNILPIAMTVINIIAGAVYTKGFPVKEKIQIYGMAVVFLALLYNSPAGLVLYWTMNNVFSLVKNIFYKLKKPLFVFWIMMSTFSVLMAVFCTIKMKQMFKAAPVILIALVVVFSPYIVKLFRWFTNSVLKDIVEDKKKRNFIFFVSAMTLAILAGIVIPSFLITSSPSEYSYIDSYTTPLYFLYNSFLQAFGLFVFWPVCIYFLFNKKIQSVLSVFFLITVISALVNNFGFPGKYGVISAELVFTESRSFRPSLVYFLTNTAALAAVFCFVILLLYKRKDSIVSGIASLVFIAVVGLSIVNSISIQSSFKKIQKKEPQLTDIRPIIHLSKTNKNVIVFMLDRAAGYLIPEAFKTCPDLNNKFTGFTYYPNTVSFGSWTIQGAPGLYGGYEYTPWSMNHKRNITMQEKHNQALSLMPFIFEKAGYSCDVIDPPYPNYDTPPVFSFLDGHSSIHAYHARGQYSKIWYTQNNYKQLPIKSTLIKRNFIWFSIFKMVPPECRSAVQYEDWWASRNSLQSNSDFIDCYSVLDFLPKLTDTGAAKNSFVLIDNEATHDTAICQAPDYIPVENVTDRGNSRFAGDAGFHGLVASLNRIGIWFDYLKLNGVYDNTRIIIIADHGSSQHLPELFDDSGFPRPCEWFNPMLIVKDFNSSGTLKTDNTYMTQADTPAIATENVINNPVNPFTGNSIRPLSTEEKNKQSIISFSQANAVRTEANNGFRIHDDSWYTVHDNIFKRENWKQLDSSVPRG